MCDRIFYYSTLQGEFMTTEQNKEVERLKKDFRLHQTGEVDCGTYIKRWYYDEEYNTWQEREYKDGSSHILVIQ